MRIITNNMFHKDRYAEGNNIKRKLNTIYNLLLTGQDYNGLKSNCPELTEDELNQALWYLASKGLRYIPTLS